MADELVNGNGHGAWRDLMKMPQWIRAVILIGPLGVIAMYLVYLGGQTLPRIEQQQMLNKVAIEQNQQLLRDILAQHRESFRLELRICAAVAKTPAIADKCFDADAR